MKKYYNEKDLLYKIYSCDLDTIQCLTYKNKKLKSNYDELLVRYNNLKKVYNLTLELLRKEKEKNEEN